MTKREILDNVRQLSREEQIDLAMELWESVGVLDGDLALTADQAEELDRRLAEADANPQPAEEAEAVKSKLLRGEF